MVDWEKTAEYQELRKCYHDSFLEKANFLRTLLERGELFGSQECLYFIHNLAGTSESYGFAELSRLSAEAENLLLDGVQTPEIEKVIKVKVVKILDYLNASMS